MTTPKEAADLKDEIKDRLTSSVPSSFILSFALWNWPVLIGLIYGELEPAARIQEVERIWGFV